MTRNKSASVTFSSPFTSAAGFQRRLPGLENSARATMEMSLPSTFPSLLISKSKQPCGEGVLVGVPTTGVAVGTTGVAVGGTGVLVAVGGTGVFVAVGGTGVFVLVAVAVAVANTGVFVAVGSGVAVAVGGSGVFVAVGSGVLVLVGVGVNVEVGTAGVGVTFL